MHGMHTVVEFLFRGNRSPESRSPRTDEPILRAVLFGLGEAAWAASSFLRIPIIFSLDSPWLLLFCMLFVKKCKDYRVVKEGRGK